jgi:AI-2 transport protein TqsA
VESRPRSGPDRSGPDGSWSVPRGFIVLLSAAGAVVVVAGLRATAGIVGPVFLALVLTIAASPLARWLRRVGLASWLATLVTLVVVYLVLIALAASLALSVARLATLLPQYGPKFTELVDDLRQWLTDLGVAGDQTSAALSGLDLGKLVDFLGGILSELLGLSSNLFLILALLLLWAWTRPGSRIAWPRSAASARRSSPRSPGSPGTPAATCWCPRCSG